VAPAIDDVMNVAVEPSHTLVVASIGLAGPTPVVGVIKMVSLAPTPQVLTPLTMSIPVPVPTVAVIVSVVLVPDQPVPITVHV
jgi:hypothetical protein